MHIKAAHLVPTTPANARRPVPHAASPPAQTSGHAHRSAGSSSTSSCLRSNSGAEASTSFSFAPAERDQIRGSWDTLMRWSRVIRKTNSETLNSLEVTSKVVVFGGGSFGTAMAASLARQKADMDIVMLLRDPNLCTDINTLHCNTRYLSVSTQMPAAMLSMHVYLLYAATN